MTRILLAMAAAALCATLTASRCVPEPTPPAPPDGGTGGATGPDGGAFDGGTGDSCDRACDRMRALGCPGYEGSAAGVPCAEVCRQTEASGVARFCPDDLAAMRGKPGADGGAVCDEAELEVAFEACEPIPPPRP